MPVFSQRSLDRLRTCDERLQRLFNEVIKHRDCIVLVGHRPKEDQDLAYRSGASKLRWPDSKHNSLPSKAVDVAPYPIPENWGEDDPAEYEKFRYFGFFVLGVAAGMGIKIRWGGDWDGDHDVTDQTFNDLVHFEVV